MWEKTSESPAERSCVRFKRPPRRCVGLLDKDVSFRHFPRGFAQVAQLVEQGIENPRVGGSIPSLGTDSRSFRGVCGSNESEESASDRGVCPTGVPRDARPFLGECARIVASTCAASSSGLSLP